MKGQFQLAVGRGNRSVEHNVMKTKIFLALTIFVLQTAFIFSQTSAIKKDDTIKRFEYYKGGGVQVFDSYIQNVPPIEYSLKKWYTKRGKMMLYDSIDASKNILYIAVYRKDGTKYFELEETNPTYKITYNNKKNEVTDVLSGKLNDKMVLWEKYKDGELSEDTLYNRFYYEQLDTVKYFEHPVFKGNKRTMYNYELADGYNFTFEKHIRMVYNTDSVLLTESLYSSRVKYCGFYLEYNPSGTISCIGEYDKRGYKKNDWYYFDEAGNVIKRERFFNGTDIFR